MTDTVGKTPESEKEFTVDWVRPIMDKYFDLMKDDEDVADKDDVELLEVRAAKNSLQGILSITYILDVDYRVKSKDVKETKHLFVKVPLKDDPNFASVNVRELTMLTKVLPQMQKYLDEKCTGFFRLPMPEVIHCYYDGKGSHDVFVLENLLAQEYENFDDTKDFDEDHMKSLLECLAQLHGTGLAYKKSVGGSRKKLLEEFTGLEEQIQLDDLFDNSEIREFFRQHFRAFLHYLEETEPSLGSHTNYMKKMHKHILKVVEVLEKSGSDNLLTICHGDAKPNNFMFRNISIDLEELECEGLQSILIDWQGGFVGSVANDLMWSLFPFLEANQEKKGQLYATALEYYFEQLTIVLESFEVAPADLGLPDNLAEFSSLLKKCLVLEFLIVTIVKPIVSLPKPKKLLKWHKESEMNKRRRFKKRVTKPDYDEVFQSPRFAGFCHLYFKIATSLGAFQELGKIYFDIMKDAMFEEKRDDYDSDADAPETELFYRIVNAPVPTLPRVKLPQLGVPHFGVYWRRLKYHGRRNRRIILVATTSVLTGLFGAYFYYFHPQGLQQQE